MKKTSIFIVIISIILLCSCHKKDNISVINVAEIMEIHSDAVNILNELSIPGQSGKTIIDNCIQQLLQNPDISNASVLEPDQIIIRYKSGVTSVILLIDETEDQGKCTKKAISSSTKNGGNKVQITNPNVLIWEAWPGYYPFSNDLSNIFNNCSTIDFNVEVKHDDECTVQSLCNLTQYGYVQIHTHGGCYPNANGEKVCWILTKEECPSSELENEDLTSERKIVVTTVDVTKEYVNNQEIRRFTKGGHYWAVTNKFISNHITGTFSGPSVVFVSACHSFDNSSLRDAFINDKKASCYLGYTNSVFLSFAKAKAIEFASNMVEGGLSAVDAYYNIDVIEDNSVSRLYEWFVSVVFDSITHVNPRATLMCSHKEDPTYFASKDYVECSALNKRWGLDRAVFYQTNDGASMLVLKGDSIEVFWKLTLMDDMIEGTYNPFFLDDNNYDVTYPAFTIPMRFIVEIPSDEGGVHDGGSFLFFPPNDYEHFITGGQLIYQKQNNQHNYTFSFTDGDGYSYNGEYRGPLQTFKISK